MKTKDSAQHWENIYQKKKTEEMSWTQMKPETSLQLIKKLELSPSARIVDVGGGNSNLVDFLVIEGYRNIEVLDISMEGLKRAQERLGKHSNQVKWIHKNILEFKPNTDYQLWHDRAAFHFLTQTEEIESYKRVLEKANPEYFLVSTFSKNGPEKCSGLPIKQYDEESLVQTFQEKFEIVEAFEKDHKTPFGTVQNFIFCTFKNISKQ